MVHSSMITIAMFLKLRKSGENLKISSGALNPSKFHNNTKEKCLIREKKIINKTVNKNKRKRIQLLETIQIESPSLYYSIEAI